MSRNCIPKTSVNMASTTSLLLRMTLLNMGHDVQVVVWQADGMHGSHFETHFFMLLTTEWSSLPLLVRQNSV